jgi:hypothetical protein
MYDPDLDSEYRFDITFISAGGCPARWLLGYAGWDGCVDGGGRKGCAAVADRQAALRRLLSPN